MAEIKSQAESVTISKEQLSSIKSRVGEAKPTGMKRITPQTQSDQGGSGIGIIALVAVLGVAAFYQFNQNKVEK